MCCLPNRWPFTQAGVAQVGRALLLSKEEAVGSIPATRSFCSLSTSWQQLTFMLWEQW